MKFLRTINPRNVTPEEITGYSFRTAARAIVFDGQGLIALLHVARDGYYKLPGGGVEEGEDMVAGLKRECLEEIGCEIEITGEVGSTIEYWKEDVEKQTSYCYLAKLVGEKGEPNFTEPEKERNFEAIWVTYDEALELFRQSQPTQFEGEYIKPRDLTFLEEAKNLL